MAPHFTEKGAQRVNRSIGDLTALSKTRFGAGYAMLGSLKQNCVRPRVK